MRRASCSPRNSFWLGARTVQKQPCPCSNLISQLSADCLSVPKSCNEKLQITGHTSPSTSLLPTSGPDKTRILHSELKFRGGLGSTASKVRKRRKNTRRDQILATSLSPSSVLNHLSTPLGNLLDIWTPLPLFRPPEQLPQLKGHLLLETGRRGWLQSDHTLLPGHSLCQVKRLPLF